MNPKCFVRSLIGADLPNDRIALTALLSVSSPLMRQEYTGSVSLSGRLSLDPSRNAVMLAESRVDDFTRDGLAPRLPQGDDEEDAPASRASPAATGSSLTAGHLVAGAHRRRTLLRCRDQEAPATFAVTRLAAFARLVRVPFSETFCRPWRFLLSLYLACARAVAVVTSVGCMRGMIGGAATVVALPRLNAMLNGNGNGHGLKRA